LLHIYPRKHGIIWPAGYGNVVRTILDCPTIDREQLRSCKPIAMGMAVRFGYEDIAEMLQTL
jgi:hypothetical protein